MAIIRRVCSPRRRVISRLMPAYLSLSCTRTHVTRPRHAYLILPLGCTGTARRRCMRHTCGRTTCVGPVASAGAAEVVESERPRSLLFALFDTFVFPFVRPFDDCRPVAVVVCYRVTAKLNWFKYIQIAWYIVTRIFFTYLDIGFFHVKFSGTRIPRDNKHFYVKFFL